MLVVTELVSIVSEKVTETVDVIETDVSPSEGELDNTVGDVVSVVVVVLSVLFEPLSLLQEMTVKLKRNIERIMSICLIGFLIGWYRRTLHIPRFGGFYKNSGKSPKYSLVILDVSETLF
jgi:hypothetical protein